MIKSSYNCSKQVASLLSKIVFVLLVGNLFQIGMETYNMNDLEFQNFFEDTEREPTHKIVAFTNHKFLATAIEWYNQLSELGYNEHILVATDEEAYLRLIEKSIRVEKRFNKNHRESISYERLSYTLDHVKQGIDVLVSDINTIFMNYVPLQVLHELENEKYDVFHSFETKTPTWAYEKQGFVIYNGFSYFKANARVIKLLNKLVMGCITISDPVEKRCNDQIVLNAAYSDNARLNKRYHLNMKWNFTSENSGPTAKRLYHSNPAYNGTLVIGVEGVSEATGHKVRVWDREFVFRCPYDIDSCPEKNWVSMPSHFDLKQENKNERNKKDRKLSIAQRWLKKCRTKTS